MIQLGRGQGPLPKVLCVIFVAKATKMTHKEEFKQTRHESAFLKLAKVLMFVKLF